MYDYGSYAYITNNAGLSDRNAGVDLDAHGWAMEWIYNNGRRALSYSWEQPPNLEQIGLSTMRVCGGISLMV